MRNEAVKMNASMRLLMSYVLDGALAVMSATAPIDRDNPKIRSTRVSILGRGRAYPSFWVIFCNCGAVHFPVVDKGRRELTELARACLWLSGQVLKLPLGSRRQGCP